MSEEPAKPQKLDYMSPAAPTRHAIWPSMVVVGMAAVAVLGAFFRPIHGLQDDLFWFVALIILLVGVMFFAVGGDKRGIIICAIAFSIIFAISILLPSFYRAT